MSEQTMNALTVPRHGGVDVLTVERTAVPHPGPGQLLIRVEASGINFKDVYMREGVYPKPTPFVLGDECAGTVVELGADVRRFTVGDRVATVSAGGAHAEYAVLDAQAAVPLPTELTAQSAAAVLLQGMTAHYLVRSTYAARPGDVVLVHAAAGGVGQLLVQLATQAGATVVATVGSAAKVEVARSRGAQHVIRYDEAGYLAEQVRAIVPDGVHAVYDGVGASTFESSLRSLRPRGTLALFGAASGQVPPFDLQRLNPLGSLFVTRPTLADYLRTRDELDQRSSEILRAVGSGALHVDVGGRYLLEQAGEAYGALEGRTTTGKLLFVPEAAA